MGLSYVAAPRVQLPWRNLRNVGPDPELQCAPPDKWKLPDCRVKGLAGFLSSLEILRSEPARRRVAPRSDNVLWTGPLFFPCTVHHLSQENAEQPQVLNKNTFSTFKSTLGPRAVSASLAQLVEHALRKRMVVGSIPTGGLVTARETEADLGLNSCSWRQTVGDSDSLGILRAS